MYAVCSNQKFLSNQTRKYGSDTQMYVCSFNKKKELTWINTSNFSNFFIYFFNSDFKI